MKKHYETHVEDTDKLISVAGPVLDYKSWYEQYRKLMEEQAQRKYGLYTPTSEGDGDDFPSITGMIARYSASGLTNEQMAENPVWKDLTGNGHDLQMKNFAWKGMSGVGGYGDENYQTFYKFTLDDYVFLASPLGVKHMNFTFRVTGLQPGNKLTLAFFGTTNTVYGTWDKDGIYTVNSAVVEVGKPVYFYNGYGATRGEFTIEILPLYPGFILGDGVDDEAVTKNNLDLEDTYTVYTPLILLKYGGVVCGKSPAKDYSLNTVIYSKSIGFDSANAWSGSIPVDLYKFVLVVCKRNSKTMYVKDLITGKSNQSNSKEFVSNPGKYFIWRNTGGSWSQVAIAGQVICNGYFSTDEDDEKVLNYYKQEYPWLFPDQAWTVTGKTNEDEDRATIANITGNGNNLVLSNFGFAKGSGYGLYQQNYAIWTKVSNRATFTVTSSKIHVTSVTAEEHADFIYTTGQQLKQKIRITGLPEGTSFVIGRSGVNLKIISQDGIYDVDILDDSSANPIIGYRINRIIDSCDITIEQIPEYEGYLVTDGVDDEVRSAAFTLNEDWTIVGNWEFITNENKNAGLTKVYSLYLYNRDYGIFVYKYINAGQGFSVEDVKSLKAICSDGRIYLNDWQEIRNNIEQEATISKGVMAIGYFNRDFTKMAFKNLGIYNNQLLSKDDCIKAYNYLQTLKAK